MLRWVMLILGGFLLVISVPTIAIKVFGSSEYVARYFTSRHLDTPIYMLLASLVMLILANIVARLADIIARLADIETKLDNKKTDNP